MEQAIQSINNAVQDMYEAFPYPDYSLFIPLRWQEAYASGSLFAQRLWQQEGSSPQTAEPRVLIAGCGDVQTAIISRWEPRKHRMQGIDLSRPSLRKARLRSILQLRSASFQQLNLENPQAELGGPFVHIDGYGMLHHLANPSLGLGRLSDHLLPGGTMRIMVYNSRARQWIFHMSRAFALLGLRSNQHQDRQTAVQLLHLCAQKLPALHERIIAMEPILNQPARLVDAFFHEREARLGLAYWLKAIDDAGLRPLGLMDRYAELDDLPNPLLEMPKALDLQARIDDLRFENNLEFYLAKDNRAGSGASFAYPAPLNLRRRMPPIAWVRYAETARLGKLALWQLWQAFLTRNFQGASAPLDRWARKIPVPALQRLSRLGALFPDQFQSRELQKTLLAPMQTSMEAPTFPAAIPLSSVPELKKQWAAVLLAKGLPPERLKWIEERLLRAQQA